MQDHTSIYGLRGFTHGWANILTVMSPAGAKETMRSLGQPEGVVAAFREGALPRFREQRPGALDRLIESHGIVLLEKPEWDAKKEELGAAIYD